MKRRGLVLGVALLVCLFSAAAANAQQNAHRPFKMVGQSQILITFNDYCSPGFPETFPGGCLYTGPGEGVATHLGRITTTEGGVFPYGGGVIIAANGDQLWFENDALTHEMRIKGGTGRFKSATGWAQGNVTFGPPSIGNGTAALTASWILEGWIAY